MHFHDIPEKAARSRQPSHEKQPNSTHHVRAWVRSLFLIKGNVGYELVTIRLQSDFRKMMVVRLFTVQEKLNISRSSQIWEAWLDPRNIAKSLLISLRSMRFSLSLFSPTFLYQANALIRPLYHLFSIFSFLPS